MSNEAGENFWLQPGHVFHEGGQPPPPPVPCDSFGMFENTVKEVSHLIVFPTGESARGKLGKNRHL
jgi:hypothetical protein